MDWEMEAEVTVLKRVVALLYSFATLAGHAGTRSPATRYFVLGLLRLAESVASRMVVRDLQHFGSSGLDLPAADLDGHGADDALSLAGRFCELASTLESLVSLILAGGQIGGRQAQRDLLPVIRQMMIAMRSLVDCTPRRVRRNPVMYPDTS